MNKDAQSKSKKSNIICGCFLFIVFTVFMLYPIFGPFINPYIFLFLLFNFVLLFPLIYHFDNKTMLKKEGDYKILMWITFFSLLIFGFIAYYYYIFSLYEKAFIICIYNMAITLPLPNIINFYRKIKNKIIDKEDEPN